MEDEPVHETVIRAVASMREAFSSAGLPIPDRLGYSNEEVAVDVVRRIVRSGVLLSVYPAGDYFCDKIVVLGVTIGPTGE